MRVQYKVTKRDIWKRQYRNWLRYPVRLTLHLSVLPCIAWCASYFSGLGLLFSAITASVVAIVPFAAFCLMMLDMLRKLNRLKSYATAVYVVRLGKFDMHYGTEDAAGYFHHWSYFEDICDAPDGFYFVLRGKEPLWVPKAAFAEPAHAQAFLTEARRRWREAKDRQFFSMPQEEGVWPPAPRLQA